MLRAGALALIRVYQRWISPMTPPSCRFTPTCSSYAALAIERFGFFRGSWLAVRRLARCHPFCEGGCDPVPELPMAPHPPLITRDRDEPTHT